MSKDGRAKTPNHRRCQTCHKSRPTSEMRQYRCGNWVCPHHPGKKIAGESADPPYDPKWGPMPL